ncbi:geranylgeranyl diphosphate synthase, type I [Streptomyces sp. DI166]|nr:geranylgeranyl diphosphate synthase, type I [Streptomyces sp. DI166]
MAILERARGAVDPELRSAIESLPDAMRRTALYHFGWQHADGTPAAGNAGKAIRPALVLTAAEALGGPPPARRRCGPRRRWNWSTTSRCCTTT